MTVSEDLNFVEDGGEFEAAGPAYPTAFGVELTPTVSGITLGVLGALGGLYLLLNQVLPAWDTYQQQQARSQELQGQIEQKKASIKQIGKVKAELAQAKQQRAQVLALFANEKTLDTLLLDLNRLVESGNATLARNAVRAKMKKYTPANQTAEPVTDGSLGAEVNGKLKRRIVNIEVEGTYDQTQSILRNIERLQPLLIVREYQSTLAPETVVTGPQGRPVNNRVGPPPITTSLQLQALIPASPEEAAKATAAAQPPQK